MIKNGMPFIVTIARDDIVIQKSQPLALWSPQYVYSEAEHHYYLGRPFPRSQTLELDKRFGWIEKGAVLDSPEALRTPNKIYRRVIVFDNKAEKRVPVFCAPKEDAGERCKTPMYSFFYIYKEVGDYYLIGLSPSVDLEYSGDDMLGWIHKTSCREWNTRLAVSYRDNTRDARIKAEIKNQDGLVKIYKTLEDIKNKNKENVIAKESEKTSWVYNMPRYPLLQSLAHEQKRIFHIAFLGGTRSDGVQQSISKIKEEKLKLSKLDIMLLVDLSSDTKPIRDEIIKAVKKVSDHYRELAQQQKKDSLQIDIAWGVTFYQDFSKGQKYRYYRGRLFEPKVVHIYPFTSDVSKFIQTLENEPYHGTKDAGKSLMYGIDMVMHEKAEWRTGSTRCLITTGVTGNHPRKSEDDVTRLLPEEILMPLQRKRIRVYSMHFLEQETQIPKINLAFHEQMSQLSKDMKEGAYFPILVPNENNKDKAVSVEKLLMKIVQHYEQEIKLIQTALTDLQRGFTPQELGQRHGQNWGKLWEKFKSDIDESFKPLEKSPEVPKASLFIPSMEALLESFIDMHGISVKDLKGGGGFFEHGWVCEFNPDNNIQQIQVSLLIDQMEMSRLIGFLSSLHMELKKASKPEQYVEIWKTLLKATFGIDTIPPNEPLDNLIIQHTGLPFMNGLLNYTLDDFVKQSRTAEFRRGIAESLELTTNRLFLILEEKEVENIPLDDGSVYSRAKKRWWSEEGNELKYSWIEVEIFP